MVTRQRAETDRFACAMPLDGRGADLHPDAEIAERARHGTL